MHNEYINFLDLQDGDIIYTTKDITAYSSKGVPRTVHTPAKGTVKGFDEKYIYLTNGDYIKNDPTTYKIGDSTGSIGKKLVRNSQIFLTTNPTTELAEKGYNAAKDAVGAVTEASKDVFTGITDAIGFISRNLTIIIVIVLLVAVAYSVSKLKEV